MSGMGINHLASKNYVPENNTSIVNANLNNSRELKSTADSKTDVIFEETSEKDAFKIELSEKQPINKINTEFGFIDFINCVKEEAPESQAQANIIDYDPDKQVSSENADFFYVNGIMTTPEDAEKTSKIVSGIINKPVTSIWSKKEGFLGDLIKAVKIDQENNERLVSSKTSIDIPFKVINSLQDGKNVKIIAHSRGASETANALWAVRNHFAGAGYTPEKISKVMNHIEVVTMGGLASSSDFPSDVKLTQIRNPDDPVPKLNNDKTNHSRNKYSRTELAIERIQNVGSSITPNERMNLYLKNVGDEKTVFIKDNIKEKLSAVSNVLGSEINVASSTAGGLLAGSIILKTLPKKGIVTSLNAPMKFIGRNSKVFAVTTSVVVGTSIYHALKKIGSAHLVNAGDHNYLGEKNVQDFLKKVANN